MPTTSTAPIQLDNNTPLCITRKRSRSTQLLDCKACRSLRQIVRSHVESGVQRAHKDSPSPVSEPMFRCEDVCQMSIVRPVKNCTHVATLCIRTVITICLINSALAAVLRHVCHVLRPSRLRLGAGVANHDRVPSLVASRSGRLPGCDFPSCCLVIHKFSALRDTSSRPILKFS
jgi:hypothetical protein